MEKESKNINQSTANLIELLRVTEKIVVTPERIEENAYSGVCNDGIKIYY